MSEAPEHIDQPKSIIHAEAQIGSSIFNITTENCDAIQLLGIAEAIHGYGMAALAADMGAATKVRSPIEAVRGSVRSLRPS